MTSSPQTEAERGKADIDRINELSHLARTAWFALLGYLVFVGVTLLGVQDADFFLPARQTTLPLVGVEIPTASFFWTAPVLGAALYTYLHLFLIKLWDAHADARTSGGAPFFAQGRGGVRIVDFEAVAGGKVDVAALAPILAIAANGVVPVTPALGGPAERTCRQVGGGEGIPHVLG